MKICLLAHSFPPVIGGGETQVYLLANEFCLRGHEVLVITGTTKERTVGVDNYPFRVIRLQGFREFEDGRVSLRDFLPLLKTALTQERYDILYVHNFMPALACMFLTPLIEAQIVFTFHSTPVPEEGKILGHFRDYDLEKTFTGCILRQTFYSALVCPSKYYLEWAIRLGAPKRMARLVYHGIDTRRFVFTRDQIWRIQNGYSSEDFLIICAARMIPRKGILDLMRAFAFIEDKKVKLYVASSIMNGSSVYAEEVNRSVQELQLSDRVRVVYDLYTLNDIPQLLANCDAMVLPSHVEGFGLVLLEGMAAGMPVIGTNTSGIKEIIRHGRNGLLAEPKKPQDIAEKIILIFRDKELVSRLVAGGKRSIRTIFSLDKQVDSLLNLFQNLHNNPQRIQ